MSLTRAERAALLELLEALCEERITPDQVARLEQMVLGNSHAEKLYITFMTLQANLHFEFGSVFLAFPVDAVDSGNPPAGRQGRRRSARLSRSIAIAATLFAAVTLGASLWGRRGVEPVGKRVPGASVDIPVGSGPRVRRMIDKGDGPIAVVAQTVGARWEESVGPAPVRGRAVGLGRYRLASGRVTFAFINGVMLTLEGPADVDLISIDRIFCRWGKLRSRVPKGAEGFIVASPSSAVVDLGTEFAMNLEDDGHAQVMVFEGAAETALLDTGGIAKVTQTINRSEAYELDPESGRIAASSARPERFVAAPSIPASLLSLDPGYPRAVLAAKPTGYWRFESLKGDAVPNEVPGGSPLRVNGPIEVAGGDVGMGCATFRPGAPAQFLTSDSLFELARQPGHATEFWFQAEQYLHASLVGFLPPEELVRPGQKDPYVHAMLIELTAQARQTLNKPASVRFLHRWPIDSQLGNNLFSELNYIPWVWHHVVAQRAGDQMELYLDGVVETAVPLETDHPKLPCRLMVGRRSPVASDWSDARPFVGRLDELAVYAHALSAQEVSRHFLLSKPNRSPE
jgi:hypothetical protein